MFVFSSTQKAFPLLAILPLDRLWGGTPFHTFLADPNGSLTRLISVIIITVNMSEENILIDFCSAAFTFYFAGKRK